MITEANLIFIAYSHSDLRQARTLRKRIVHQRPDKPEDSVFLDQDCIAPGEPIGPAVVERRLGESDLVIILCGIETARSPNVNREIGIALEESKAKGTKILPVILKPHLQLPPGLDFSIQGIFLANLFPVTRIIRWAVATVMGSLLLTSVFLYALQTRTVINLALEKDQSLRVPGNLGRREMLEKLLFQARLTRFRADEIRSLLAQVPAADAVREIFPPDPRRTHLAISQDGMFLFIGSPEHIDVRRISNTGLVHSVSLTNFTVGEPSVTDDGNTIPPESRTPANLIALVQDPTGDGVLAEVGYEGSSKDPDEKTSEGEKELLQITSSTNSAIKSVGYTRPLKSVSSHDLNGEEYGGGWSEIDPNSIASVSQLVQTSLLDTNASPGSMSLPFEVSTEQTNKLEWLASDPAGRARLLASYLQVDPDGRVWKLGAALEDICALVEGPDKKCERITPITSYHPDANHFALPDLGDLPKGTNPEEMRSRFQNRKPSYRPAALHWASRQAVLRGEYIVFTNAVAMNVGTLTGIEWDHVTVMDFTLDGKALLLSVDNGDICKSDLRTRKVEHRFKPPPRTRQTAMSLRGDVCYILRDDGAVLAWNLDAFGSDGWAALQSQ